jgi:hypothetical protein
MRKTIKKYKDQERRIIKYFALLPVTINDSWRWLETVEIEQVYSESFRKFYNIRFTDQEEIKCYFVFSFENPYPYR